MHLGRKRAQVFKNQVSPGLLLGSPQLFTNSNTPVSFAHSPLPKVFSPRSESPIRNYQKPYDYIHELLKNFPKYTKAHPKYIPSHPIVEGFSVNKRLGDVATRILMNRNSLG